MDETAHDYALNKKPKPLFRLVAALAAAVLIFAAGVAVGHKQLLLKDAPPAAAKLDYSSVDKVYELLRSNFDGQVDDDSLLDGLKHGLVSATKDPYTTYFNPAEAASFEEQLNGSFTGIGAELGTDADNDIVIVAPLSGYPAAKAGLKPKDKIVAIDGESAKDLSVDAAVQKIRGPEDTKVTLTVARGRQAFEVTMTRVKITIPSVESSIKGEIGVIKISQFNNETLKLVRSAADRFTAAKVKGLVLDLRNNPGGYLKGAVDIASLWLKPGDLVVQSKRGGQVIASDYATSLNLFKGMPTAVLINGGSASASEITAGALSDHKAATIVGQKSFGKGSIQSLFELEGGAEVKITVARWYTPGGRNIDKNGIEPSVKVGLSDADIKAKRDSQLSSAIQVVQRIIGQ